MTRVAIAAVVVAVVVLVAWRMRRRPPDPPPRDAYPVPRQLDRADFPRPDAPWLVVLFSSSACLSCQGLPEKIVVLESSHVATCDVDAETRGELHRRYELSAIPMTLVVDGEGVVHRSFVGAFTATDLWAAVAEAREPGSSPEPDLGR